MMPGHVQSFTGKCLALAAQRLAPSEPFTFHSEMPRCFGGSRRLSLLGRSKLEEEETSKTTMIFRVQLLVFSHCTKNVYNIVRDLQRMLLTNFSFRHELLSRMFISFAFFALSPFL